eukprot:scaffold1166_cov261-Pinguiococcus_pyrenoidosus.AAC.26
MGSRVRVLRRPGVSEPACGALELACLGGVDCGHPSSVSWDAAALWQPRAKARAEEWRGFEGDVPFRQPEPALPGSSRRASLLTPVAS